jgi:Ion channel
MKKYQRNLLEFLAIILLGELIVIVENNNWFSNTSLYLLIVFICWSKTTWFIYETSQDLDRATHQNMPYHQFLTIVGINMAQVVVSFGIDYYTLLKVDNTCFNEINPEFNDFELLFECVYFSALNYSYFGYGDITPANIPAKLVSLTEILLGFLTVIFILSDFITLKESIKAHRNKS